MPKTGFPPAPLRLLVVQTAFLGDVVLTTPLLRELRRAQPRSRLSVLTTRTGAAVLDGMACIDELIVLDKGWSRSGVTSTRRVLRRLRHAAFDVAVAAHRSVRSGLLVRLSGAPLRIGFAGAPGAGFYRHRIPWRADAHAVRRYLALGEPLGVEPERADPQPELRPTERARRRAAALLRSVGLRGEPFVAIAPGSVWPTKRWLPAGFARVAAAVAARGLTPLLVGTPDERELCLEVAALARVPVGVLAGRTRVAELVALLAGARAVVANDSGAAHVASAVGTPVVSVFGPTVPAQGYVAWGPASVTVEHAGLACRPCHRHGPRRCPLAHHRCMRELTAERVLEALEELLRAPIAVRGEVALAGSASRRAGLLVFSNAAAPTLGAAGSMAWDRQLPAQAPGPVRPG